MCVEWAFGFIDTYDRYKGARGLKVASYLFMDAKPKLLIEADRAQRVVRVAQVASRKLKTHGTFQHMA